MIGGAKPNKSIVETRISEAWIRSSKKQSRYEIVFPITERQLLCAGRIWPREASYECMRRVSIEIEEIVEL